MENSFHHRMPAMQSRFKNISHKGGNAAANQRQNIPNQQKMNEGLQIKC